MTVLSYAPAWVKWGLVALIQIGLVATPLAERIGVHMGGREVVLAMQPIDPRDLLRGDYVIVSLEIERVDRSLARPGETFERGDTVYVSLEKDAGGVAHAAAVSTEPPVDGALAIRGEVTSAGGATTLAIDYGLDAFYVPEGTGRPLETADRNRLRLVIALTESGKSAPLRITLDGKTVVGDTLF
ncbi:GDYXXLXY domain-containing protein [Stappia sp. F7233]|uniref:GDYXXLXY domain-containing protein n=1 Tax=Stappia albiluteola TaxID=2758565 RepID=A0A839AF07_9HYPH|nr:GDYXXLXY domain-containing protein [Stappia albiluteola]MBA5778191.1 GDYXXLXY domain-containing protein [Stappia albiluteola]